MSGSAPSLPPPPAAGGNILRYVGEIWRHIRKTRVKAGNGMRLTQTEDGVILSAKPEDPFEASFTVEQLTPTKVLVRNGYTCDRFDGVTLYADLEITIAAETYIFAKYVHQTGWQEVTGHVIQNAGTLPADDDAYTIYPIAKVEWVDPPGAVGIITQYDVGNLIGADSGYRAFFAKITAHSAGNYAFTEQAHDGAGVFTNRTGGYSGTTSVGPAREASGLAVDLATDIIVPMVRVPNAAGDDTFVFTLAHWLASSTTSLDTTDGFTADTNAYVLPRTANLEIPIFTRSHQSGTRVALFTRNLKLDANGNPVALSVETKVLDFYVLPAGTTQWDVPTWDTGASPAQWIADVVRGHS